MGSFGSMIANSCRLGIGYSERLLTNISATDFGRFARPGDTLIESNHPAFVFGHLSLYPSRIVQQLGDDANAILPTEQEEQLFSKDAKCVDDPDGTIYPPMDQIVERFRSAYSVAIESLENAEDATFQNPNPTEGLRERFPTVGGMHAFYVGGHFMVHMGQLSAWRRMMGMGPA